MPDLVYQADLTNFISDLEVASGSTADEVATQVISTMGDEVAHLARAYAPRDTGLLASSITHYRGPLESRIVAEAPYAAYVEFGTWSYNTIAPQTGTYTITPKTQGGSLRFSGAGGRTVYAKKVEHPGIKAQPYMGRAAAEVVEKFTEGIGNVGVVLILGDAA